MKKTDETTFREKSMVYSHVPRMRGTGPHGKYCHHHQLRTTHSQQIKKTHQQTTGLRGLHAHTQAPLDITPKPNIPPTVPPTSPPTPPSPLPAPARRTTSPCPDPCPRGRGGDVSSSAHRPTPSAILPVSQTTSPAE